jgi:hypothetical protein
MHRSSVAATGPLTPWLRSSRSPFLGIAQLSGARAADPEGFQNLGSCCGSVVLVNESTDYIAAVDLVAGSWCDCGGRLGWEQRESAMRAFAVLMDRVGAEDTFEVTAAEDQQPVETLAAMVRTKRSA